MEGAVEKVCRVAAGEVRTPAAAQKADPVVEREAEEVVVKGGRGKLR